MKKLLALVLCVMMFVSVLSTAAFAAAPKPTYNYANNFPTATNEPLTYMGSTKSANDAISHAKSNIEYMYGALAADNAVFGTVKSMDDVINGMITDMFDGTTGKVAGLPVDTLKDNVKAYMKDVVGSSIIDYLSDNFDDFTDISWERKADATTQTLTLEGNGKETGHYVYSGPNGAVYEAVVKNGKTTWYAVKGTVDEAKKGTASVTKLNNFNGTTNDGGNTWMMSVPKSSLSYTGKSFIDPNSKKLNYVYTGANGQIYALNKEANTWWKTDDDMTAVLNGTADWKAADVTLTQDVDYDPIKYANTFAAAVSDAFNSKQGAANVQAIMYQLYSAKVLEDVNDKLEDLYDDVREWENSSTLLDNYHFNEELFVPYAFMNQYDTPEALFELPTYVWAP